MPKTFHNILVPFDGTSTGNKAFKTALKLSKDLDASITLLACIEENPTFGFFNTKSDKKANVEKKKQVKKDVEKLKKDAESNEVEFKSKIVVCNVASKYIISYTKDHKIDLIVMEKSKTLSPASMYHESTVNYIDHNAKCSILNVK